MAELVIRSDNADKIKQALHDQVLQALDECGVIAAKAAQQTVAHPEGTGDRGCRQAVFQRTDVPGRSGR